MQDLLHIELEMKYFASNNGKVYFFQDFLKIREERGKNVENIATTSEKMCKISLF